MGEEKQSTLTVGGLRSPMMRLLTPLLATGLLQTSYNLIDTFWLGRLSTAAVGAISLAFPVIFVIISLANGFVVAGSALVSQYTGAESEWHAGQITGQTLLLVTVTSIVLGFIGYSSAATLFEFVPTQAQTTADVVPLAVEFMQVFFAGLPTLLLFIAFQALMRGYGDTRTPMLIMAGSILVNVALDPVLIFGVGPIPKFGIGGAAMATVFARGLASIAGVYLLFASSVGLDVKLVHLVPDGSALSKLVRLGVPSALEDASTSVAIMTVALIVASFSPGVVAAYGIGSRILAFVEMVSQSFGRMTNTVVGQNLGAEQPGRAKRAIKIASGGVVGTLFVIAGIVGVFAPEISSLFLVEATEQTSSAIRHSVTYLRVLAVGFVFQGVFEIVQGAFRGAGNTRTAFGISVFALWIGRVAMILVLLAVGLEALGIWIGMVTSSVFGSVVAAAWLLRGTWTEAVVGDQSTA